MDATALLLSRLQFAFTISFHIIFPSFTIGLAAWLTILEALYLATGRPAYRVVFEFWLKIFGVAFGLGVVSGIVMAFQFGTNWDVLGAHGRDQFKGCCFRTKPSQPFFSRPVFLGFSSSDALAFHHGSTCFRPRWWRWAPRFRRSGSWLTTAGCRRPSVMRSRTANSSPPTGPRSSSVRFYGCVFPICCSLLTSPAPSASRRPAPGTCCAENIHAEARIMLRMGLLLGAVLVPVQLFFGHLNGDYVHDYQPAKFAAIEGRWHDQQPASEVVIAVPDPASETNLYAISIPVLGSLIGSMSFDSKEVGLTDFPLAGPAPNDHSVLRFSNHGWLRSPHVVARLGRILFERQRTHRKKPPAALGDISQLSTAVHRHIDRLVHG